MKKELSSQAMTGIIAAVAVLFLVAGYMWFKRSDTTAMGGMSDADRAEMAEQMKKGQQAGMSKSKGSP